jgi:hypothetical protein
VLVYKILRGTAIFLSHKPRIPVCCCFMTALTGTAFYCSLASLFLVQKKKMAVASSVMAAPMV